MHFRAVSQIVAYFVSDVIQQTANSALRGDAFLLCSNNLDKELRRQQQVSRVSVATEILDARTPLARTWHPVL